MKNLITHLSQFISEARWETFRQVIANRTRYITVVLEDIYQSQNASAVLRTCDCLGIQDVHIIENKNRFQLNPDVVLGSSKWLNLHKHCSEEENTISAMEKLRSDGYRIVATSPHRDDTSPEEFDLTKGKVALFFGTELKGLTSNVLEQADEYLRIPIVGFTESFNISVSAAIILYQLTQRLRSSEIQWGLTEPEREELLLEWLRTSIKKPELIEAAFNLKKDN